jgi:hypothetical protein
MDNYLNHRVLSMQHRLFFVFTSPNNQSYRVRVRRPRLADSQLGRPARKSLAAMSQRRWPPRHHGAQAPLRRPRLRCTRSLPLL